MKMKQAIATLGAAGLLATSAQGQAVVYEPFDYPLDESGRVTGNDGGIGFNGAWTNTKNNPFLDPAPGLTAGDLPTAGGNARGAAWSGLSRPIGSTLADANLLDDGATLWMSAILDLTGANLTNADLNIALTNSDKFVSNVFGNRLDLNGDTSEGIGFGHTGGNVRGAWWQDSGNADGDAERNLSGASTMQIDANGVNNPTGYLVVAKIEWGVGAGDETITLYNPASDLTQGPEALAATAIPALDQSTFDTLAIQFKDSTPMIDEIRFAGTYEEVVGGSGDPALPGDTDGDGDIDDADLGTAFSNFTGPVGAAGGKTASEGDTDGDGDVDDADLANAFSGFTGPLGPAAVPEPASLALLGLGGLLIARRRRA